ncbi:phage major capsid protein, P2 family [Escherichia coli]|nr:phage major capsid protein, P2 family [Escherichia coli]
MQLNKKTGELLRKYTAGLAAANNADSTSRFFALTDPKETALRSAIMHSDEFLKLLPNVMDVEQIRGQVVTTGAPGIYTGRKKDGRFTRPLTVDGNEYSLAETDSGAFLPYNTLVTWANAGSENEFFDRIQAFTTRQIALDMLRIGFNGIRVAEDTEPDTHFNGEDVNTGWHQIVKERTATQIVPEGPTLGKGGDFVSLDAAAADLVHTLIHEAYRGSPDLVVLVAPDLVAHDKVTLLNAIDAPTEKVAAQLIGRQIAGMNAYTPPFMPEGRLIVTTLANLHIYTQRGTRQRKAEWNDDRKRFENNYLRMEGYAVEHDELYAAFDKLKLKEE